MIKNLKKALLLGMLAITTICTQNSEIEKMETRSNIGKQIRESLKNATTNVDTLIEELSDIEPNKKHLLASIVSEYLPAYMDFYNKLCNTNISYVLSSVIDDYSNAHNITSNTSVDVKSLVNYLLKRIAHDDIFNLLHFLYTNKEVNALPLLEKVKVLKKNISPENIPLFDKRIDGIFMDFINNESVLKNKLLGAMEEAERLKDNFKMVISLQNIAVISNILRNLPQAITNQNVSLDELAPYYGNYPLNLFKDLFETKILPITHNIFRKSLSPEAWNAFQSIVHIENKIDRHMAIIKILMANPALLQELYDTFAQNNIGKEVQDFIRQS